MKELVFASTNMGKIAEIQQLLQGQDILVIPQGDLGVGEVEETGLTFVENALLKARFACEVTGRPALADDSGLAVDYLQGGPGIYSARYAGTPCNSDVNIAKLLKALSGVKEEARTARFICILVFMRHAKDPMPGIFQGIWEGRVLESPRGNNGFGYDPVMYINSHRCSAAELPPDIKNKLSHRGQAFLQFQAFMKVHKL